MLRRVSIVLLLATAFAAAPAWASACWHSQYVDGTHTSDRTRNSACRFSIGSKKGSLRVDCSSGGKATLVYDFKVPKHLTGKPTGEAHHTKPSGSLKVHQSLSNLLSKQKLRVTATISGRGSVTVTSVCVGYYA